MRSLMELMDVHGGLHEKSAREALPAKCGPIR